MSHVSVVTKRGVPRGRLSRTFSGRDLLRAAADSTDRTASPLDTIYVEEDEAGWVWSARGVPAAAARARLAPHVPAANLQLSAAGRELRLVTAHALAPGDHLLLWFDEPLLALVDMPFLTPHNIRGKRDYVCHKCGVHFELPNHLKVHLFLQCGQYSPLAFWRVFAGRLAAAPAGPRASAFRPYAAPRPPGEVLRPPGEAPARLEALAAELGRSPAGHLCLYCGKLYSRKYGLKIHIRTHTGYKPLHCRYCLRAFGDPSNLNKHVRLHAAGAGAGAGAVQHACSLCGARLARRRDLVRHVRARHAALASAGTG